MHEFSLCQSIINTISNQLKDSNYPELKVKRVILTVGTLAAIDIPSLQFWFPVACKNTSIDGAKLKIIEKQANAKCLDCQSQYSLTKLYQACPFCQSYEREVLSGMEMIINKFEISKR